MAREYSEQWTRSMLEMSCLSCKDEYNIDYVGTYRECYEEESETEEELKKEIEELKARIAFLKHGHLRQCLTNILTLFLKLEMVLR
ncbi:hypothetical protein SUGI_0897940 [Cryptomeria japonica]|nr:hypothetical protein SUGI_0897940 [Cryptomeria japonica]